MRVAVRRHCLILLKDRSITRPIQYGLKQIATLRLRFGGNWPCALLAGEHPDPVRVISSIKSNIVRMQSGQENLPRDIDPAKWVWTHEVGDVKCALRWIVANAAKYNVDANRIGIFGHSAGANLTALAAYTRGDRKFPSSCPGPDVQLKFVVNVYLPSDLALMYETTGSAFVRNSLATTLEVRRRRFPTATRWLRR